MDDAARASHPDPASLRDFEDFSLGQRFTDEGREISAQDLLDFAAVSGDRHPLHVDAGCAAGQGHPAPLAHGPLGLAGFFGWVFRSGMARDATIALLDTHWRYLAPVYAGDRVRYDVTITACRRASSGGRGIVGRHVRVLNQHGALVQEGTSAVMVRARGSRRCVGQELLTRAWAQRLALRLEADPAFQAATSTWDGAIGLEGDGAETALRIYRGRIIEAGPRMPNGPTFTVKASDLAWAWLVSSASDDFMRLAMQGAFSVRGEAYEYVRHTRTMALLAAAARAEFQERSWT
ncbi:MaoC family dehydratase [Bordetella genomosp. 13]|uniref:MaoC family dehydratase n=1 Tax=Bordetella genomosp. 13 TaxID=463040 RepID=UPI0011A722A1|nr:MaoC/PaaZ C-terminal domain-containing protein [Bordetella genomosp. 13]